MLIHLKYNLNNIAITISKVYSLRIIVTVGINVTCIWMKTVINISKTVINILLTIVKIVKW